MNKVGMDVTFISIFNITPTKTVGVNVYRDN